VDRPTVLIISDEAEFAPAVMRAWRAERNGPAFSLKESAFCGQLKTEKFDVAIVAGVEPAALESVLNQISSMGRTAIHVSRLNGSSPKKAGVVTIPNNSAWAEVLPALVNQVLECQRAKAELAQAQQARTRLEQNAALGRYMLDARHNLNNALTSVLGNSDLLMMDSEALPPNLRAQVAIIRNMSMRMNEIMQRFSSLQKEMQLVEQQVWAKKAKSAGA
jgi:signal transduction histidine kinase